MRKAITTTLCVVFLSVTLGGCFSMRHTVGNGGTGQSKVATKQWFLLWGLVPLTDVDGGKMAGGATDYTIQTQYSFVDWLISIATQWVTIYPMTVTVTK